jgi:hypothetical protein
VANYPLVDVDMGIGRHYGYRDASPGALSSGTSATTAPNFRRRFRHRRRCRSAGT